MGYLEHYKVGLVKKALKEREILYTNAPHIITPMRFVLPQHQGLRPAWLIRIGLFCYDHLGRRKLLSSSKTLNLRQNKAGEPLKDKFTKAFEYSDCWVDDARLVILNAIDTKEQGATILTQTRCIQANRVNRYAQSSSQAPKEHCWKVTIQSSITGNSEDIFAKAIVNATGHWVDNVIASTESQQKRYLE